MHFLRTRYNIRMSDDSITLPNSTFDSPPRRRRRILNMCLIFASLVILTQFYIGLAAAVVSFNYLEEIPLADGIAAAGRVAPIEIWTDRHTRRQAHFLPLATAVLLAFVIAKHSRWKLSFAIVAVLLPFTIVLNRPAKYPFLPMLALWIPEILAGKADGETWSEGFVALSAAGVWMILWTLVAISLLAVVLSQRRLARRGFAVQGITSQDSD